MASLTTPKDEIGTPVPLADRLRRTAHVLETGGVLPFRTIAAMLRDAVEAVEADPVLVHSYVAPIHLANAIHMLHEDAHGDVPFKSCSFEPCRDLALDLVGPAPTSVHAS